MILRKNILSIADAFAEADPFIKGQCVDACNKYKRYGMQVGATASFIVPSTDN